MAPSSLTSEYCDYHRCIDGDYYLIEWTMSGTRTFSCEVPGSTFDVLLECGPRAWKERMKKINSKDEKTCLMKKIWKKFLG